MSKNTKNQSFCLCNIKTCLRINKNGHQNKKFRRQNKTIRFYKISSPKFEKIWNRKISSSKL